jgi:hypothetical protein
MVDGVSIKKSQSQVLVFMSQERLIVKADVNQLFGTKHDAACNWIFYGITPSYDLFPVINQQVVTSNRVKVGVLREEHVQNFEKVLVHVIICVYSHHQSRVRRRNRTVQAGWQSKIRIVSQHDDVVAKRRQNRLSSIGTAIVYDDDVEFFARKSLSQE